MSSTPTEATGPQQAILLPIRDEDVPRLLAALEQADAGAEVAGFAFGRPVKGGPISGTGCTTSTLTMDFKCKDSDRS